MTTAKNVNFGKKIGDNEIEYAPMSLRIAEHIVEKRISEDGKEETVEYDIVKFITHPTEKDYLSQGWKKIHDNKLPEKDNHISVRREVEETELTLELINEYQRIYRKFSRMKLKIALASRSLLEKVKAILQAKAISQEYSAWDAFEDCTYISEDFEQYDMWKNEIQDQIGLSDKETEELLSKCLY